jgi:Thioredoxin-like/DinB superfamily
MESVMTIDWITQDRHEEAIAASAAGDKPILIYFHSKSCDGCQRLEREVLSNEAVQSAIGKATIPMWVEVEQGRVDTRVSSLVGSHIFIMSPVVQVISFHGDIFHKFLGAPLHTRLDLGYTRVHHDVAGDIGVAQFLGQLHLGVGKRHLFNGDFALATQALSEVVAQATDSLTYEEARYWLPVAQNSGRYPEETCAGPIAPALPALSEIANEVRRFCSLLTAIPDTELMADWPGTPGEGGWAHYSDCLREVCLGVYQTLLDSGNAATRLRQSKGVPLTQAQLILQHWQESYRSLQGTLQGLRLSDWDRQHLHENYSLGKQRTVRNNIVHCVMAEFWAHGSAIRNARAAFAGVRHDGSRPVDAAWKKYGPPPANFGTVADLLQTWELRHNELLEELAAVTDAELDFERSWWEESGVSVRFRLNRLGWHLQDHAAVLETICERIGRVRTETERLAVRIFTALGTAEGAMIGLPSEEKRGLFSDAVEVLRRKGDELQAHYARFWDDVQLAHSHACSQ